VVNNNSKQQINSRS
jgi:hypothetical protein